MGLSNEVWVPKKTNPAIQHLDHVRMVQIRRQLHMYPEVGFDLPLTVELVKNELENIGVQYTDQYGKSSLVAFINDDRRDYTIAFRADMDAVPIREISDKQYRSRHKDKMHACGHDAHTAILLGIVRALFAVSHEIQCRIVFIFQASEEGPSGAKLMVEDGVTDEFDCIVSCHVDNRIDCGSVGFRKGVTFASSDNFKLEFFGKTGHAATPHEAVDAIDMGIKAYTAMQAMTAREIDPLITRVLSVCIFKAGKAHNILPEYCLLEGTLRTHSDETVSFIKERIRIIAQDISNQANGEYKLTFYPGLPVVDSDNVLVDQLYKSALDAGVKAFHKEKPLMYGEDFAHYLTKKRGAYFFLGTRNASKNIVSMTHNNDFDIDEDALLYGACVMTQFVFNNMRGI